MDPAKKRFQIKTPLFGTYRAFSRDFVDFDEFLDIFFVDI